MIICDIADRRVFCFCGDVAIEADELICRECGAKMHIHAHPEPITLRHVPFGGDLTCLRFPHNRFFCPSCGATRSQYLSNSKEKKMTKKGILSERQMKLMNPIPEKDINELPENVQDSLNKYNDAGWAEPVPWRSIGTHAGGKYNNSDNQLPSSDNDGNEIQYKEWDVKNHNGHSRDASRFITWTEGSVYYTDNHYESFVKILPS